MDSPGRHPFRATPRRHEIHLVHQEADPRGQMSSNAPFKGITVDHVRLEEQDMTSAAEHRFGDVFSAHNLRRIDESEDAVRVGRSR